MQKKVKAGIREYGILTLATIILNVGIYVFKYPNHFVFGGVTGIAVLITKVLPISASAVNLIINMALLGLGFLFLGFGFGAKTVYVTILSSISMYLCDFLIPMNQPLTNQKILEMIFAIFLPAVASAILINYDASSGGTDIVAMILKKYTSVEIGTAILLVDCLIALASFVIYDVETGLFSVCGLIAKSLVVDNVIESLNVCKYFNIVCDKPEPICDYICRDLGRDATVYEAEGAFTHNGKFVIMTVMRRRQALLLRKYVKSIEPTAFIMISTTSEIIGKGFRGVV